MRSDVLVSGNSLVSYLNISNPDHFKAANKCFITWKLQAIWKSFSFQDTKITVRHIQMLIGEVHKDITDKTRQTLRLYMARLLYTRILHLDNLFSLDLLKQNISFYLTVSKHFNGYSKL